MKMDWFHGTTNRRFAPGDVLRPGREIGSWSNFTVHEHMLSRELDDGRIVHPNDVVWLSSDAGEAEGWAHHSTMKALGHEIRAMGAGGIAVYEVAPIGPVVLPVDQHVSEPEFVEAACASAVVVREVSFEAFPTDYCDECGDTATVGLGTEEQLCEQCAEVCSDRGTVTK